MEKLMLLSLPLLLLLTTGCAQDEPRVLPCGEGCEIVEELVNVTAKVVQWPITCDFVLSTDSATLVFHEAVGGDSTSILLPCEGLPPELRINGTLVTVSGYKYNCCDEFASHETTNNWRVTGCRFEITSIEASPIQLPPNEPDPPCDEECEILEELIQIRARVFRWGPTCEYVLETDSTLIAEGKYLDLGAWNDILVPCEDIPQEYLVNQLLVTVSGYKYNCCHELEHPVVDPGFGCRFEITSIEPSN